MTPRFRRAGDGRVVAGFDAVEVQVLRLYVSQVRELLEPDEDGTSSPGSPPDPLEELTGLWAGPGPARPTDPALERLLPDGYGPGGAPGEFGELLEPDEEDERNSAEFRRLTERDLRTGKVVDAETLLDSLPETGGRVVLDAEQASCWLRSLNDVRLALGTRLGVSEDAAYEFDQLPENDPRATAYEIYVWLTVLQESLLSALVG